MPPAPSVYRQRDCAAGIVGGCRWWKKDGRIGGLYQYLPQGLQEAIYCSWCNRSVWIRDISIFVGLNSLVNFSDIGNDMSGLTYLNRSSDF